MAEILSPDEIDALLGGMDDDGGAEDEASSAQSEIRLPEPEAEATLYDFSRSELSVHGQLPGLENIYNKFARRLRTIFATELGKAVYVGLEDLDSVLFEDLVKRLSLQSSIHMVRLEPLRGLGVFVIGASLAYAMIDIFFGGTGQRIMRAEEREFTLIENNFLGKFVSKMLLGMEEVWQPVIPLTGQYISSEMNPYLLGATAMADVVVIATYTVEMTSQVSGEIIFSLPLSAVEQVRERLGSPFSMFDEGEDGLQLRKRLKEHVLGTEVTLHAMADVMDMTIGQILSLRNGDFLELTPKCMERAGLWVEDKPLFQGRGAQDEGTKVFVIEKCIGVEQPKEQ